MSWLSCRLPWCARSCSAVDVDAAAELDEHVGDYGEGECVCADPSHALVEELGYGRVAQWRVDVRDCVA